MDPHPNPPAEYRGREASGVDSSLEAIREKASRSVAKKIDPATVREVLRKRFDDPIWGEFAKSCLACGTCAYACPTCHCFDIQDESAGKDGIRQKNWDACAFPLFTLHTSGHNPRPDQPSRWRQRLSHKFRYYPEKFRHVLCTGCGRCARTCPSGQDITEILSRIDQWAAGPGGA
jgi:ferredoxin